MNGDPRTATINVGDPITLDMVSAPAATQPGPLLLLRLGDREPEPGRARRARLAHRLHRESDAVPRGPVAATAPLRARHGRPLGRVPERGRGPGPARAPWTINLPSGLARPLTVTLQGVLEDNGAANAVRFSVTNALVLRVQ